MSLMFMEDLEEKDKDDLEDGNVDVCLLCKKDIHTKERWRCMRKHVQQFCMDCYPNKSGKVNICKL